MTISICIPQFNRLEFLLKALEIVAKQTHPDVEICIADDASTDDTAAQLARLQAFYRYPIRSVRHATNQGYDRTLRRAMELATGDYCLTLGNDDALNEPTALARLATLLDAHQRPEVGFTNYVHDATRQPGRRAATTRLWPGGEATAWAHYASFGFVSGLFFRRDAFQRFNTDRADGSVFVQMYLAVRILLAGGRLLTVAEPLVVKDLRVDGQPANSWQGTMHGHWRDCRKTDGGLPQVVGVVYRAFADAGVAGPQTAYRLFRKHYRQTYPYWLLEYRSHGGLVNAVGLAAGFNPVGVLGGYHLGFSRLAGLWGWYAAATVVGLLTPPSLFQRVKTPLYTFLKRRKPASA